MTEWSHPVASFWAGDKLSFIEQMVIKSYLEKGCDFTLYLAHPIEGIPAGTTVKDAAEIMPRPAYIGDNPDRKALAVWSDLFRVALLLKRKVIWVDMDAYCIAPYSTQTGYLFGLDDVGDALSGVMALPQESPTLQWMADFLFQDELAPPWRDEEWLNRKRKKGLLNALDLPWGDTGPGLLTYALKLTGAMEHASAQEVFYPVFKNGLMRLWRQNTSDEDIVRSNDTCSVHIFGYTKRFLTTYHQGLPPKNSWLARRAEAHGIDPASAPAWAVPLDPPAPPIPKKA